MLDAGGGGGAVIGSAVGDAAKSIGESMAKFASAAASGGFEVSPEGGDALIRAIDGFTAWVDENSWTMQMLQQKRKLGGSQAAQAIAPFNQQVAEDDQGFIPQLMALRESLNMAREGILTAMQNYRNTDAAGRSGVQQAGGTLSA